MPPMAFSDAQMGCNTNSPERTPIAPDTIACAPYSYRAPSPPFIHIPVAAHRSKPIESLHMLPSYEYMDETQLTRYDLQILTGNRVQSAKDRAASWRYEERREAQAILDFLSLGPSSVVRDHEYLKKEGITLILVARDSRMVSHSLPSVEKAAAALGIEAEYIDVDGPHQLIQSLPEAVRLINSHVVGFRHRQTQSESKSGHTGTEGAKSRGGHVLLTCETGNERAPAIAAAYIMAVFGKDMVTAIQFISIQRFCCAFGEDLKRVLQTWEDIIRARSAVSHTTQAGSNQTMPPSVSGRSSKRGIDSMMQTDSSSEGDDAQATALMADEERFAGRLAFSPFSNM